VWLKARHGLNELKPTTHTHTQKIEPHITLQKTPNSTH